MATEYPPPPTWANPINVEKDPATGESKASFNPVWMDWFIRLTAILSAAGGASGALGSVTGPNPSVVGHFATWANVTGTQLTDTALFFADNETPTGAVDGANKVFALAHSPNPAASLLLIQSNAANWKVYVQGVDYTLAAGTATFGTAPAPAGATMKAFYRYTT